MEPSQARTAHGPDRRPERWSLPPWEGGPRFTCLLTTLHPERALSRALVQHLSQEMPDIAFTLQPCQGLSAVWVCGYEPGAAELVRELRARHPDSFLVVTGRGDVETWRTEVLEAGADYVCSWPIPFAELSRILHRTRRAERI